MKKRILPALLLSALLLGSLPASAAISYSDVPLEHWSASDVELAAEYGLMEGVGDGLFGLGRQLDRASFVTILSRMFSWSPAVPAAPSFSDCPADRWYYSAVESALAQGVIQSGEPFRPTDPITRREMAVMLVKALGYESLVSTAAALPSPFGDVSGDGYITLAHDIGMTNGVPISDGSYRFLPDATATREEAAAMLVRVYQRYTGKVDFLHGFYAFSSYSQIQLTAQMEAVSLGWSRMSVDPAAGPWLNTTREGGNEWVTPDQPQLATDYFEQNGTRYHLSVYASTWESLTLADGTVTNPVAALLSDPAWTAQAVSALVAASEGYGGLTIDFEGMKGSLRDSFTAFMTQLRSALPADKGLYVCVPPDTWYDGFDYRALGQLCDKVILMAHDYQWTSVPASYVGTSRTENPVTPFPQVYTTLRAITDPDTGVQDLDKIVLAISFSSAGLQVDADGKLASTSLFTPSPSTIITRLRQADSQYTYSQLYRNPSLIYTADGQRYRLWYEDAQSVADKIRLAQMFGIRGVSLWRLGNVPQYSNPGLHYDVWQTILSLR